MVLRIFLMLGVFVFLGIMVSSCAKDSKTTSSLEKKEYKKNIEYIKDYVKNSEKEKVVNKKKIEKYDRALGSKSSEVLVKVDADKLERDLKKHLDKRELETSMVSLPPTPVIVPAKVIRILIYPYIDNNGNFHGPNYIYTEIRKSRWVVGDFNSPSSGEYGKGFTILER